MDKKKKALQVVNESSEIVNKQKPLVDFTY